VGKLADAIYEGRHGQLESEVEEYYDDYEGSEDDYEAGEIEELDFPEPDAEEEAE
jgi:small subunit ribosomal protein S2